MLPFEDYNDVFCHHKKSYFIEQFATGGLQQSNDIPVERFCWVNTVIKIMLVKHDLQWSSGVMMAQQIVVLARYFNDGPQLVFCWKCSNSSIRQNISLLQNNILKLQKLIIF